MPEKIPCVFRASDSDEEEMATVRAKINPERLDYVHYCYPHFLERLSEIELFSVDFNRRGWWCTGGSA